MKQKMKTGNKKILVVIPGLNEEKHIGSVISRTKNEGFLNIIFVDDGSTDKSSEVAKNAGAEVLRHVVNMGKGCAARTGCDYALKMGAEVIVLMDADGQHRPEEIKKLVEKLWGNDIVFGYRRIDRNMPLVMGFGNWVINTASRIINGLSLRDTQSGFRCMTSHAYRKVRWRSNNYSMESEMIANVSIHKLKYVEVQIDTIYLDKFKGTTITDGLKIFINLIKFRLFGGK